MITKLWVDIETYSTVDLRTATPYRYAEDPEFLILMGSWATDEDPVVRDCESQEELLDSIWHLINDPNVVKVAHNAAFERICFSKVLGLSVGMYLPIQDWHDTQAVAGCQGYPQKLATLAPALGAEKKDEAGTHLINWFCKPDRNGRRRLPEEHPEKWAQFVAYCNQDVVSLMDVDRKLGDFPTETERLVYFADQRVNDIGLPIDLANVELAANAVLLNQTDHEAELGQITGLAKPNNPNTLREWIAGQETHSGKHLRVLDLRSETVDSRLEKLDEIGEPDTPLRRALELRQELAGTASKKYVAALQAVSSDSRMRGAFRYFGAHTGRWSGRGAQPQNLPRHTFSNDADVLLAIDELQETGRLSPDELKRLVRPMFTGPSFGAEEDLTVVDYSSIEARVIAWLAGEEWALKAFRAGRDIYVETAERMGGLTRAQGKIAVLALGFGGGPHSLRVMAGGNDSMVVGGGHLNGKHRNTLQKLNLDPDAKNNMMIQSMPDELIAGMLVQPWRKANPRIVRFWYDLEEAFAEGRGRAGRIQVTSSEDKLGKARHLHLPSGRAISYHNVRHETYSVPMEVTVETKTGKQVKRTVYQQKTGWRYADPRNPFNARQRIATYGGRLAENATQAVARDVLAEALVRLQEHGHQPVGHVHDEILTEGSDLDYVQRIMTEPPGWAAGLPIDAEGFVCRRYKKG